MKDSLAFRARDDGAACQFYTAGFAELIRVVARLEWAVAHTACRGRGDPHLRLARAAAGSYE